MHWDWVMTCRRLRVADERVGNNYVVTFRIRCLESAGPGHFRTSSRTCEFGLVVPFS